MEGFAKAQLMPGANGPSGNRFDATQAKELIKSHSSFCAECDEQMQRTHEKLSEGSNMTCGGEVSDTMLQSLRHKKCLPTR